MAPKPPAAKGPAKPARTPTKLEECLSGYNCAMVGIIMMFCVFLYTVWYISLYAVERAKRDPLRQAVAQIRQYMISLNAEYDVLNDTNLLLEAEKVARQLIPWAQKIKELQTEIAELHYKLNHDWTAFNGHLYLFGYSSQNFDDTIELCNKSKSSIADIHDDEEESCLGQLEEPPLLRSQAEPLRQKRFIEESIKMKHGSYWIGLQYSHGQWKWVTLGIKPKKEYWQSGYPGRHQSNKCGRVNNECNTHLNCWITKECYMEGRGICKQKPETKWIS